MRKSSLYCMFPLFCWSKSPHKRNSGIMTSFPEWFRGALTTTFTPAASCAPFNDPSTITSINHTLYHPYNVHTECQPALTVGGCCPAEFELSDLNWCTSTLDGSTVITMGISPDTTLTGMVTGVARADVVQIRFRQDDELPPRTSYV
jgi:hypothetical protein